MRVEIDLVDTEYERLLEVLRPFIDAGRVEASIPAGPAVSASEPAASAVVPELMSNGSAGRPVAAAGAVAALPVTAAPVDSDAGLSALGDGGDRDLLADLTVIAAGRVRVGLVEAASSLRQLDPVAYAGWADRVLARELPEAAKPYNDQSGRWVSTKKILTARGLVRHRRKSSKSRKSLNSASRSGVAKRSFQNEVDVSVVDDKRLSDLPFDLSSRGQWKLDKSF